MSHATDASVGLTDGAVVRAASGTISATTLPVTLPIETRDVSRLGAATVQVGYDPALLRVTGCQRNPAFDVGLCNTTLDRNGDGVPDAVLFNVISLNGVSTAGSPIALVQITWAAVGPPAVAVTTTLGVEIQTFTDSDAKPIAVTAANGQITLAAVPASTATPTATPTPTPSPTPTATPRPAMHGGWLPLVSAALPPATPPAAPSFTCGGWCGIGGQVGARRQAVFSDQAVADWRMIVDGATVWNLTKETTVSAVAEAPEGVTVRIEALFGGQWLRACESVVACP